MVISTRENFRDGNYWDYIGEIEALVKQYIYIYKATSTSPTAIWFWVECIGALNTNVESFYGYFCTRWCMSRKCTWKFPT